MLDSICLPSMVDTMVLKLLSSRIRSATPLATSLPEPSAIPILAALSDGASFTHHQSWRQFPLEPGGV